MTNATPGPWKAVREDNGDFRISYNELGNWLAAVYDDGDPIDGRPEADARLIAAAPDLKDALVALLPEIDAEIEQRQTSGNDEYWQGLKALSDAGHVAIAKAEGRS